ncbi:MAG: tryptophan--tRNA ligase [Fimbriimonadaceae bacterium]|nr:tryptophan--tRNA ligase [Fimbriimonadaceae bacterium]QYK55482.1 MAG: tryptophan--tRNA ligase [Fimbriimonadaceae bacterium]
MEERKRILSGTRATNPRLHLGNYEGALRPWVALQEDYKLYCMVADYHALTTMGDVPPDLRRNTLEVAKDFVAAGLDPERTSIFVQSHVPQHAELHLIFSMVTGLGKLERVPTFKEKKDDLGEGKQVSYGLLGYPVLQAADILLYKPYGVPVGKDQAPHLELSREIGRSFNAAFDCDVFPDFGDIIDPDELRSKVPGTDADESGQLRKMSKSYDNCIYLFDTPEETAQRIMGAYTTPSKLRKSDPGIPEGCAVCQLLKLYSPDWERQWEEDRAGERGCMQNKRELIEAVNEFLRPIRARRAAVDDDTMIAILKKGAEEASDYASQTMAEVRRAMRLL